MKIMAPPSKGPRRVLLHSEPPTLQQATASPCLHWRLLDSPGQVWVSLLWSHCSFLLGSVCALQEPISQSCVCFGSSIVGLMAASSKRAYAIPKSAAPSPSLLCPESLPLWQSTADPYLHKRHSNPVLSQSLQSLWVLVQTKFV